MSVRAFSLGLSARTRWRPRPSTWGQLLWVRGGTLVVTLDDARWAVPPDRALWLPPGCRHTIEAGSRLALHTLHCTRRLSAALPREAALVARTPLLAALCDLALDAGGFQTRRRRDRHLVAVLLDTITPIARDTLLPPLPVDPRAVRAAEAMLAQPREALGRVARRSGASLRTLARLFRAETGYGVGSWRRRAALARAAMLLREGRSVTAVALEVGYESTSAFVSAFRAAVGETPGRYGRG